MSELKENKPHVLRLFLKPFQITDSLKNFGLGENDTEILAVVLDQESGEKLKKLNSQIKGQVN